MKKILLFIEELFVPTKSIRKSKKVWNEFCDKNLLYRVYTEKREFGKTGERDYKKCILDDQLLQNKLPCSKDKIMLEIGCGFGRMTEYFANDFKQVYASEISEKILAGAKKRVSHKPNIYFQVTNGVSFPFSDNYFDFVFSFLVFQHMPSRTIIKKHKRNYKNA